MNLPMSPEAQKRRMLNSSDMTNALCTLKWMEKNPRPPEESEFDYIQRCDAGLKKLNLFQGVAQAALNHAVRRFFDKELIGYGGWDEPTSLLNVIDILSQKASSVKRKGRASEKEAIDLCVVAAMLFYHTQIDSAAINDENDQTPKLPLDETQPAQ